MTRLLVVGSSQVAAVVAGWNALKPQHPDADVEFLAAPVSAFRSFRRDDEGRYGLFESDGLNSRVLSVVEKINGTPWRRVADFTHVAVVGFISGQQKVLELIAECGIDDFRPPPAPGGPLISSQAFRAQCAIIAAGRSPAPYAADFREAKLAVVPSPVRSERVIGTDNEYGGIAARLKANPRGVLAARAIFESTVAEHTARIGVTHIPQDERSLSEFGFSKAEYSQGALRLDPDKTGEEYSHLNADYGRMMMERILDWFLNGRTAFI